jgi:hypothetical protein
MQKSPPPESRSDSRRGQPIACITHIFEYTHCRIALVDRWFRPTSKMSHDRSRRAACFIPLRNPSFLSDFHSIARGVTAVGVGSGALFGFLVTLARQQMLRRENRKAISSDPLASPLQANSSTPLGIDWRRLRRWEGPPVLPQPSARTSNGAP